MSAVDLLFQRLTDAHLNQGSSIPPESIDALRAMAYEALTEVRTETCTEMKKRAISAVLGLVARYDVAPGRDHWVMGTNDCLATLQQL